MAGRKPYESKEQREARIRVIDLNDRSKEFTPDERELVMLLNDNGETRDSLASLKEENDRQRERIQQIVERLGGSVRIPGIGDIRITPTTVSHRYDTDIINALLDALLFAGGSVFAGVVEKLEMARIETEKKASLYTKFEKRGGGDDE